MTFLEAMTHATNWLSSDGFYERFSKDLRPGFFTGFLTIGGFLYSAHTFIIIHMK